MKITNNTGLPEPIFNAVNRQYHKVADYSVTELIAPIKITKLKKEHENEITEDASDRIWALIGSSIHSILEKGASKNALSEEYLKVEVSGKTISGMPDYFDGEVLQDYKVVSVWSVIYGGRDEEYIKQLSAYAYMYHKHGFEVKKAQIVNIIRDWSKSNAKFDMNYPQSQIVIKDYPIMPMEEVEAWIKERIALIESVALPNCSEAEMWSKEDVYAVMKEGRKSALKLFDKESEAVEFSKEQKGVISVVKRCGERTRCESYCPVSEFCEQFKKYKEVEK